MDVEGGQNRMFQERTNSSAKLPSSTIYHLFQSASSAGQHINMKAGYLYPQSENIFHQPRRNLKGNRKMLSGITEQAAVKSSHHPRMHFVEDALSDSTQGVLPIHDLHIAVEEQADKIPEVAVFDSQCVENKDSSTTHLMHNGFHTQTKKWGSTRSTRYLEAEQALTESLQLSVETPGAAHNLKIDALTRATSVLAANAIDAREGAEKLRALLANREIEPTLYKSMQRQRWMEERRQLATEQLLKVMQRHLSILTDSPSLPQTSTDLLVPPTGDANAKSRAKHNLDVFFASSHQLTVSPTRNRSQRRVVATPMRPQKSKAEFPRIHHHKQLLPLRLKVPKHRPLSQTPTKQLSIETQPLSIEPSHESNVPKTTAPTSPIPLASPPQLQPISEAPEAAFVVPAILSSPTNGNGTVMIWRDSPRSTEEILSDLVVDMPDYVGDLLAGFDSSTATIIRLKSLRASSSPRAPSSTAPTFPNVPLPQDTPNPHHVQPHNSPSHRRISGLFSVPEALSSRRGSRIIATPAERRAQSRLSKSASIPPSSISLGPPTIAEEDPDPTSTPHGLGLLIPVAGSIAGLSSAVTLASAATHDAVPSAAQEVETGPTPVADEKVLARLRRRMSALRRH